MEISSPFKVQSKCAAVDLDSLEHNFVSRELLRVFHFQPDLYLCRWEVYLRVIQCGLYLVPGLVACLKWEFCLRVFQCWLHLYTL